MRSAKDLLAIIKTNQSGAD